ncbi:hypothetical protein AGMMS49983_21270 [Clostridia bacterium]|nr:hypothetical protein AGMMS49983_21270 [Clostridia bacterium]
MAKELTPEQKKLNTDLWIIVIASMLALVFYIIFQSGITNTIQDSNVNILLRVLLGAAFQFGTAGLGITIVSVLRRESFISHGLRVRGVLPSVLLCVLCFVPYVIFALTTGQASGYLPFQMVWTTEEVLASGFPANAAGMLITAAAWGFFEGFNYVVISDKINKRYPSKNRWLNWGAIVSAILCILIHGAVGVNLASIIEMFSIMIIIYGMLIVRERTGNAWGCVFIFVFLWNAF